MVRETKSGRQKVYRQQTNNTILKMQGCKGKNAPQLNLKLRRLSVRTFLRKWGIKWTKRTNK